MSTMVELDELNVPEFCRSSVGLEDIYTAEGLWTRERAKYRPNAISTVGKGGRPHGKCQTETPMLCKPRVDSPLVEQLVWETACVWGARLLSINAVGAARVRCVKGRGRATGKSGERPPASSLEAFDLSYH